VLYDLFGVVNHFGPLGFGHYTAFIKNNNKWWSMNDSHVSEETNPENLITENAYILFYK
jgi:ubiquitin carboxyl-terminal hydrolase 4/11/15